MTLLVPLILAACLLGLLRASIIRRRRLAQGLPVGGTWHFPAWLRHLAARLWRRPRWLRRRRS